MSEASRWQGSNLYPVHFKAKFGDQELSLDVPEGVWNPTPHGIHLGNTLLKMDFTGDNILELGTGCGIHAILLAQRGAARMTLTEIEGHINDNAIHNLKKHHIDIPIETVVADWTNISTDQKFDTLVTNPPCGKAGKTYRRYFIDTMILDAHKFLKPGGRLVYIQSSMADIPRSIRLMEENGFKVKIVSETSGPFRDYYFDDATYMLEMARIPGAYSVHEGKHYERLMVFEATLS